MNVQQLRPAADSEYRQVALQGGIDDGKLERITLRVVLGQNVGVLCVKYRAHVMPAAHHHAVDGFRGVGSGRRQLNAASAADGHAGGNAESRQGRTAARPGDRYQWSCVRSHDSR